MIRPVLSTLLLCALMASTQVRASAQAKAPAGGAKAAASTAIVNVNTASAAEFEALPGVGAKLAARNTFIVDPQGKIAKVFTGVKPAEHSEEVLSALAALQSH